jgi:putative methionine-R-sulfoxide reductase with GAF domain/HAMP domain-containing protein
MTQYNSEQTSTEDTNRAQQAFRFTVVLAIVHIMALVYYFYVIRTTGDTRFYIPAGVTLTVLVVLGIGAILSRRGRPVLAVTLGLGSMAVTYPLAVTALRGLGITIGPALMIAGPLIALQVLPRRWRWMMMALTVISGLVEILLDVFGSAERASLHGLVIQSLAAVAVLIIASFLIRGFQHFPLRTKTLLLGIGSVVLTAIALVAVVIWQSNQYNAVAQNEFSQLIEEELGHVADGVYNMVVAQDESVQQQVNYNLNVAHKELQQTGRVRQGESNVQWKATNQYTQESIAIDLPQMLAGDTWLGQNTDPSVNTPVVDEVQRLVGGAVTVFQRMNAKGDMLRVATNVQLADGKRATGTYIPAVLPDGTANPVTNTILSGKIYRGTAYVVNSWYNAAYEPLLDENGKVIGMLFVGVKQQSVESLRKAILNTKLGETGYVFVIGSEGDDLGHYIISQGGTRDGENIWEEKDANGNYNTQMIVNTALKLKPGETTTVHYLWQNPGESKPRWKVASLAYYEPWHWVIGVSLYEDELTLYRDVLQAGQTRMVVYSVVISLIVALAITFLSVLMARSVANPIGRLVDATTQIAAGNFNVTAKVEQQDEIGLLAATFNDMTSRLYKSMEGIRRRSTQVTTVGEISRRLSAATNPRQLAVDVVEQLQSAFNYYHAHIYFFDEAGENLVMAGGTGEAGVTLLASGHKIPKGRGLVGRAADTNAPVLVPDVSQAEGWLPNPLLPDTRAEVAVPISSGKRVFGVLDVQHSVVNGLSAEDVELLQSLTGQIAISLQNARTLEESRAKAELESMVNIIGQKIQKTTSVEDALQTAIREIGVALGASRVSANISASQSDGDETNRNENIGS